MHRSPSRTFGPASMGLMIDASILIDIERRSLAIGEFLEQVLARQDPAEALISAVTVMELEHGCWRTKNPSILARRRVFLDTLFAALPIESVNADVGRLAAKIDAESRLGGIVIPLADLLIGTTALAFGHTVATRNPRHFQMIPRLRVVDWRW